MSALDAVVILCQIHAGDTNRMNSTVLQIEYAQRECHYYYAKCLKKKDLQDCMIKRQEDYEQAEKERLKKLGVT